MRGVPALPGPAHDVTCDDVTCDGAEGQLSLRASLVTTRPATMRMPPNARARPTWAPVRGRVRRLRGPRSHRHRTRRAGRPTRRVAGRPGIRSPSVPGCPVRWALLPDRWSDCPSALPLDRWSGCPSAFPWAPRSALPSAPRSAPLSAPLWDRPSARRWARARLARRVGPGLVVAGHDDGGLRRPPVHRDAHGRRSRLHRCDLSGARVHADDVGACLERFGTAGCGTLGGITLSTTSLRIPRHSCCGRSTHCLVATIHDDPVATPLRGDRPAHGHGAVVLCELSRDLGGLSGGHRLRSGHADLIDPRASLRRQPRDTIRRRGVAAHLAEARVHAQHRPPGEPTVRGRPRRVLPGVAVDHVADPIDRGAVEDAHVSVHHGGGLTRLLAEVAQQLLELLRLATVRELAGLRRQRILRRVVEEHGGTGEVVALPTSLECFFEHLQLIRVSVA